MNDSCVLFTANDAYLRGFDIHIPSGCRAAINKSRHADALGQMRRTPKAATAESVRIDLERLPGDNSQ